MNKVALEKYLEKAKKMAENSSRLFLMNGYQMKGTIVDLEDDWLVFWDPDKRAEKVIFYHAISTIE